MAADHGNLHTNLDRGKRANANLERLDQLKLGDGDLKAALINCRISPKRSRQ